ncbi:MAG TPA: hypothetical protein VEJ89_12960 [Myxococcaceae bacterium]|nr:hypothetical protein [Myxococcaceae bacterium]
MGGRAALGLALAFALAACGVRGNPRPPLPETAPPAPAALPDAGR